MLLSKENQAMERSMEEAIQEEEVKEKQDPGNQVISQLGRETDMANFNTVCLFPAVLAMRTECSENPEEGTINQS